MVRSLTRAEPIEHQVGADKTHNIALWDGADSLDVTGKTASLKIYKGVSRRARKPWTGNALLTLTSAAGEIALTTGNAAVTIADTSLSDYSGPHWYILLLTADGTVTHRSEGEIFLRKAPA